MDQETFKVMWDLSAPQGGAEGCFLRICQTECFSKKMEKPNVLETMPDVSSLVVSYQIRTRFLLQPSLGIYLKASVFLGQCLVPRSQQ
jgi:hypothetical protein